MPRLDWKETVIGVPVITKELCVLRSKAIERKHILAKLRRVSYIIGAVSCVLIIIGATAVLVTAPYYGYPINVGGGCFFGAMGIIKGLTVYWMCYEVERMAKSNNVSMFYQKFAWRGTQWILIWMDLIGLILALVFSGVLTTKACLEFLQGSTNIIFVQACSPYPALNLALSLLIMIFTAIVLGLKTIVYILKKNPVIRDFRRRTEDLECNGKIKISTLTVTRVPECDDEES